MADNAGEDANIQPRNTPCAGCPCLMSQISKKAALSGFSSGRRFLQARATISKVPKRTGSPTGASMVTTRAVILSNPPSTAMSKDSSGPEAGLAPWEAGGVGAVGTEGGKGADNGCSCADTDIDADARIRPATATPSRPIIAQPRA